VPKSDGYFKKGVSGNPGGRPKKLEELAADIQSFTPQLTARLKQIALEGEEQNSVAACKLLYAYAYGNPQTTVSAPTGAAIGFLVLPPEEK
jgi:Family of unknown function (DUF5681)